MQHNQESKQASTIDHCESAELRDLLSAASKECIRHCCEQVGVKPTGWHQQDIVAILLSPDLDPDKIRKATCSTFNVNIIRQRAKDRMGPKELKETQKCGLYLCSLNRILRPICTSLRAMLHNNTPPVEIVEEYDDDNSKLTSLLEAGEHGHDDHQMGSFVAWLSPVNGYARLEWYCDGEPQNDDWIGLFSPSSSSSPSKMLTWQWASAGRSYETNQYFTNGISVRCYRWDYYKFAYVEVYRSRDVSIDEQVAYDEEYALHSGCWLSADKKGHAMIKWCKKSSSSSYDWVGLFEDANKADDECMSKWSWEWANKGTQYVTWESLKPGMHARYFVYDYSEEKYVCIRRSKTVADSFLDLDLMYNLGPQNKETSLTLQASVRMMTSILVDQMTKLCYGEPSVLSPGFSPFPGNILFKNLSYDEIKVMVSDLYPFQYYQCVMMCYNTYQFAMNIADKSERTAKRHAFFQIAMRQEFGEDFAVAIGKAHQRGRPGTDEDNEVDDENNKMARWYVKENPYVWPDAGANLLWKKGLLRGYTSRTEKTRDEL